MKRPTSATDRPLLVYGPWSARYDLGLSHPLTPRRFGPGIELLTAMSPDPPTLLAPEPATDEVLAWVHDPSYVRTVRRRSDSPFGPREAGLGPGDTPAFPGMHDAAAAVAGGSVEAIEAILVGETTHAFHPGGGLHHAMPDRASGFCVYDDPALAIARARRAGLRVLYVDLDVHHGDGVQAMHWDDPGVLTFSIHQSGMTLFPGTGFIDELGEGEAAGTAVNLPMEPGTGEDAWLGAIEHVLPGLAAAFGPDLVVSQHGADAHAWDPLANLRITTTAMGKAARLVDAIAHRWAGGRWLATGGGGYDVYRVVPRTWTLVWLAAMHAEHGMPTPAAWRDRWADEARRYGQVALPEWLEDEPNAGLRVDGAQEAAARAAGQTAGIVRELVVPALVRAAVDLGWWDPLAPPSGGRAVVGRSGEVEIIDRLDVATLERLEVGAGVTAVRDPAAGFALIRGALGNAGGVQVTAAVSGALIVGLVVSAQPESPGARLLLSVGIAPSHRRRGLGAELLGRHVAAADPGTRWEAVVSVAERDPLDPLSRSVRAEIARPLFERSGFHVERARSPVGLADPEALVAHRG